MNTNTLQITTYVSIAVIAISLFFIGTELTGNALSDTGIVNVTIDSSASIIFQSSLLNFGNGTITPGETAIVNSSGGKNAYWTGTAPTTGLILENNGNINVSFTLMANKTAAQFIGGTNPQLELMVSNNESGSCSSITNYTTYAAATTDPTQTLACENFSFEEGHDSVIIDAQLTMSSDATGAKTVGITATATAI